jgi:hypothetical protein
MAAFANDRSPFDTSNRPENSNSHRRHPSDSTLTRQKHEQLPEGACNFRDLAAGIKPPGCGCRRFWLGSSISHIGQVGLLSTQQPWCACGHHACFHDRKESSKRQGESTNSSLNSKDPASQGQAPTARQQHTAPTQPWPHRSAPAARRLHTVPEQRNMTGAPPDSGVAQIPSFHLTSSELRPYANYYGSVGLGLDFHRSVHTARLLSQSPTVPDAAYLVDDLPATEPLPSTRQASTEDHVSPSGAFMRHILDGRHQAPLLDTIGASKVSVGLGFGDLIQSATEVATPSISATPNLTGAEQLIQEAADIVNTLEHGVAAASSQDVSQCGTTAVLTTAGAENQEATAAPPTLTAQVLQEALREVPGALRRLAPLISSLQDHLTRNPDISIHESINNLVKRMDALENASFNQLPPEQVHEQFQHMDMRLMEVETKTDEHGRLLSAFDIDVNNRGSHARSKQLRDEHQSFASNGSLDSATSSALIVAAIDRVEAEERLKTVEGRLDILETLQLPSASLPWEVEVVLLPWSSTLRGIWYESSEVAKPGITQEDADWTQVQIGKASSRASLSLGESGWSERAIHQWANDDGDRLWPKACGVNGTVYHRLRSRGLVRKVMLTSSGARDMVGAVSRAFGDLLIRVSNKHDNDTMDEDSNSEELLGLTAPFIPLRKVHKSSCLRFLTDAELVTPALWTAQSLAADVMMRASGGQKRLFITTREGYVQEDEEGWTWSKLRQLPRIHDPDSQRPAEEEVPEADAFEPCWKHHPAIDDVASAQASFHSHINDEIVLVDERALTKASHSTDDKIGRSRVCQPITPISEFPPTQASSCHQAKARTLSISMSDAAFPSKMKIDSLPHPVRPTSQQSKRRIRSFEQAANPSLIASLPTFVPSPSKGAVRSMRIKKRRRIARSKSASSVELATQSSGQFDAHSLHPEADPEQVLQHLQYAIPTGSEIKPLSHFEPRSRDGFRRSPSFEGDTVSHSTGQILSSRVVEKRGVTPSAYATPYSGTVAGAGAMDEDYMQSESGEDDWAGVDANHAASGSDDGDDDDDDDDDDDMEEDDSELVVESDFDADEAGVSDAIHADEDDGMISSEDELQLG